MPSKKSPATNNRNLFGNAHGAGKGDKSRTTNVRAYADNYDLIDWTSTAKEVVENQKT